MRGAKCNYGHPIVYKNIEEFGLCKDKCDLIHQLVCRSFWFKGFCTRSICGFIHSNKMGQRAHTGNGYGNAGNRGHNQNGRDYQQYQGAPVMGIEPIELIETIDVIINNTKGIPVIGIETTEITVVAIKTTKTTRHKKHMTSIQIFYPNNQ